MRIRPIWRLLSMNRRGMMNSVQTRRLNWSPYPRKGSVRVLACAVLLTAAAITVVGDCEARGMRLGPPMTSWQVAIETSGGFSGRGLGDIVIASGGEIEASTDDRKCSGRLTQEQLESIAKLVSRAKPLAWRQSYVRSDNRYAGADQFQYTLRLTLDAKSYQTSWYEVTSAGRPRDLRELAEAVWNGREPVIAECRREGR